MLHCPTISDSFIFSSISDTVISTNTHYNIQHYVIFSISVPFRFQSKCFLQLLFKNTCNLMVICLTKKLILRYVTRQYSVCCLLIFQVRIECLYGQWTVILAFTNFNKAHHLTTVVYKQYTTQSRINDGALQSTHISYKMFKVSVRT